MKIYELREKKPKEKCSADITDVVVEYNDTPDDYILVYLSIGFCVKLLRSELLGVNEEMNKKYLVEEET